VTGEFPHFKKSCWSFTIHSITFTLPSQQTPFTVHIYSSPNRGKTPGTAILSSLPIPTELRTHRMRMARHAVCQILTPPFPPSLCICRDAGGGVLFPAVVEGGGDKQQPSHQIPPALDARRKLLLR
jgi:hypothetical protein